MPPKKEEPKTNLLPEILILLIVVLFLSGLYLRGSQILVYYHLGSLISLWYTLLGWFAGTGRHILLIAAVVASIVAVVGIVYALKHLREIERLEKEVFAPTRPPLSKEGAPMAEGGMAAASAEQPRNEQWERIIEHLNSPNESDWRLAVIGADIMLDDLLTARGYHGDSIGDKLKAVDKSDLLTLDAAWQAHKVRNRIAHDGPDFPLNEREAKQTLALYESVFKECKVI